MKKYMIMCAKASTVAHINYHFTQFGKIVDYLDKLFPNKILAIDYETLNFNLLQAIKQIIKYKLEYVCMYVTTENLRNSILFAKYIKRIFPNVSILAYGNTTILIPNLYINSPFDAIHKDGDYETCIQSFFKYYNVDNTKLEGMYVINEGNLVNTKEGTFIGENDWGISNPTRVPINKYIKIKKKKRFVINISKGCPFSCKHCLINIVEGKSERRRSISNLKDVISRIYPQYAHIKLWAANFTLNKQYVYDFCNLVKEYFPDLTWECATKIDLIDDNLLKTMSNYGCKQINLGIETLNEEKWIKNTKDYSVQKIDNVIDNVQKFGIKIRGCIMLGIPGQTKESIYKTIDYLILKGVDIRPTIFTPYHLLDENISIDDIDDYNKKTFNAHVDEITYKQLINLLTNIKDYKKILK